MKITGFLDAPKSIFMEQYINKRGNWESYYDYPYDKQGYINRTKELEGRSINRPGLVQALLKYNEKYTAHPNVIGNIESLLEEETLVVIGGQQAGLLLGPMYTFHKIVHVIHEAKRQTDLLGKVVVPVFWIAGEDHDYEEINHITHPIPEYKKYALKRDGIKKESISNVIANRDQLDTFVRQAFNAFGESEVTNELVERFERIHDHSTTLTDVFAYLVMELFEESGLVIFDSGSSIFSSLKITAFKEMIMGVSGIQDALLTQQGLMVNEGFTPYIQTQQNCAHLFIEVEGERELLSYENGIFSIKGKDQTWTKDQMVQLAGDAPHLFSNNVVTRPVMQDQLFPVLAFVAGPGELVYWGELKKVFCVMGIKMPLVLPRNSVTYVEPKVQKELERFELSVSAVCTQEFTLKKKQILNEITEVNVEDAMQVFGEEMEVLHGRIRDFVINYNSNLTEIMEKNRKIIMKDIEYVEQLMKKDINLRYSVEIKRLDKIENCLKPKGHLQERVWNLFYFINTYGDDFVREVLSLEMPEAGSHYIVNL